MQGQGQELTSLALGVKKTRMSGLPDGEKVLRQLQPFRHNIYQRVTDGHRTTQGPRSAERLAGKQQFTNNYNVNFRGVRKLSHWQQTVRIRCRSGSGNFCYRGKRKNVAGSRRFGGGLRSPTVLLVRNSDICYCNTPHTHTLRSSTLPLLSAVRGVTRSRVTRSMSRSRPQRKGQSSTTNAGNKDHSVNPKVRNQIIH